MASSDHTPQPESSLWLSIIGIGEDGLQGLGAVARAALDRAEIVFGAPRHLALAQIDDRGQAWPVPFDLAPMLAQRGKRVAVLASGDPFWHGAGGSLTRHIEPQEWQCFPAPSCFGLAASRLGWRLEDTINKAMHAQDFEAISGDLAQGVRLLVTLREGNSAAELADWLAAQGWGASRFVALQALGGPKEALFDMTAEGFDAAPEAPLMAAIECRGDQGLPACCGLPEDSFSHDGQITKSPIRALTLAALAPRRGEVLWDLGAGSGSVSVEWCRAGGLAHAVELRADRCINIAENTRRFGLKNRLTQHQGASLDMLPVLPRPDAVFVGGGFDQALFQALQHTAPAARLVVNAVMIETQSLLAKLHQTHGGELMKFDIARAAPLGRGHSWSAARSIVQWVFA